MITERDTASGIAAQQRVAQPPPEPARAPDARAAHLVEQHVGVLRLAQEAGRLHALALELALKPLELFVARRHLRVRLAQAPTQLALGRCPRFELAGEARHLLVDG